jgi:hypothetical protein
VFRLIPPPTRAAVPIAALLGRLSRECSVKGQAGAQQHIAHLVFTYATTGPECGLLDSPFARNHRLATAIVSRQEAVSVKYTNACVCVQDVAELAALTKHMPLVPQCAARSAPSALSTVAVLDAEPSSTRSCRSPTAYSSVDSLNNLSFYTSFDNVATGQAVRQQGAGRRILMPSHLLTPRSLDEAGSGTARSTPRSATRVER